MQSNIFEITENGIEKILICHVQNQTDMDDNVIMQMQQQNITWFVPWYIPTNPQTGRPDLVYKITYQVPLLQYLFQVVNRVTLLSIVKQVAQKVEALNLFHINLNTIIWDLEYIFIDPVSMELSFICVPLVVAKISNEIVKPFLKNMMASLKYDVSESCDYIAYVFNFLNDFKALNVIELVTLCDMKMEEPTVLQTKPQEIPQKEQPSKAADNQRVASLQTAGPAEAVPAQIKVMPRMEQNIDIKPRMVLSQSQTLLNGERLRMPISRELNISEDFNGTTLLMEEKTPVELPKPYLLRTKTNEKIYIIQDVFRIGKGAYGVEYSILDNQAVSRNHASIVKKNSVFYIQDNESTNRTYVNGKPIQPKKQELLLHDTHILLANEEFIYKLR